MSSQASGGSLSTADRRPVLLAVTIVFTVASLAFVGLRLIRNVKIKKFGWDDALLVFSMLLNLATNGLVIAAEVYGDGQHLWNIHNPSDLVMAMKLPLVSQPLSAFTLFFVKASVGVTLLLFGLSRKFNIIIVLGIILAFVGNITAAITIIGSCHGPASAASSGSASSSYNPAIGSAQHVNTHCLPAISATIGSYLQAACNIVVDITFVVAPIIALRSVKLRSRDRFAINFFLSLMFLATIACIIKVALLPGLLGTISDLTWATVPVSLGSVAEIALSIMAACLPSIRQLFGAAFPTSWRIWSRSSWSTGKTNGASDVAQADSPSRRSAMKSSDQQPDSIFDDTRSHMSPIVVEGQDRTWALQDVQPGPRRKETWSTQDSVSEVGILSEQKEQVHFSLREHSSPIYEQAVGRPQTFFLETESPVERPRPIWSSSSDGMV